MQNRQLAELAPVQVGLGLGANWTRPFAATAAVLVLLLPLSLKSLRSETPVSDQTSLSPDKRWEYRPDESDPKIVKAGTNEVALDLSDQPGGNGFRFATVVWAPDSKRFAFNYGQGREHATSLYQLRDDHWVALKSPSDVDDILNLPQGVVKAQLKKAGISKKMTYLRELQWTLKVRQWIDPNTAILYASLRERAERGSDLDREDLGYFGADFLFTLKFDDNGNWKIVKTHRMSGKGEESQSNSVPLAEEVAYQSPKGSYRIQASADGTALWIVPTNDPARRKVLPDADPDNRLASEFSSSPDEKWLYDDRQSELYRDIGELSFAALNKKEWMRRATARLRRRLRKCLRPWSISNPKPIAHRIKRDAREPTARAGGYFIVPLHGAQYDPQLREINALPRFEDKKAPPKRTSFLI